jgi:hypothetical protein
MDQQVGPAKGKIVWQILLCGATLSHSLPQNFSVRHIPRCTETGLMKYETLGLVGHSVLLKNLIIYSVYSYMTPHHK